MTEITLTRPDDWHLHLRDGDALADTVAHSARQFRRAIIMPNLQPPVIDTAQAAAYRERILAQAPAGTDFQPLMTLYLTDLTSAEEIHRAFKSAHVYAAKLYPAGATTNSAQGVTRIDNLYPALEAMAEVGLPLLVHGEVTHADVDIFDREQRFIDEILLPLSARFSGLKIVLEHITTRHAVDFVLSSGPQVAATITAHHLLYNRNHMLVGGIKPHYYCLPILKRQAHQQALLDVLAGGSKKFFLGTDSAPHSRDQKESACGCAGCYTAHAAIELYAEVFDELGALDKLESFASFNGPDFYGLARNTDTITLRKQAWTVPSTYPLGNSTVVPLRAGEDITWSLISE